MVVVPMLPDATGSRKLNMAAGLQTGTANISASRQDRNEIPTPTHMFSGTDSSTALRLLLRDITVSQDFNMAAPKPEVSVIAPLGQIESKFQLLHQGFWGRPS